MSKSLKHVYWRTLLVVIIVLVITAGALIGRRVQSARELEQVVASLGGEVEYAEFVSYIPIWLDGRLSDEWRTSLHVFESRLWKPAWLNFSAKRSTPDPLTDEEWFAIHKALRPYRHQVVRIVFAGSQIGNETVTTLPEYPKLQSLDLRLTNVDDGCLDDIGAISKLSFLELHSDALTADGHERLIKLREQRFFQVNSRTDILIKNGY
ncbi:MAG: hypothetical protein KDA86_04400 [Planctomycetaceae bacterium]|nr:hypothetical protein [Planctomycetaceae bacterium]MCA9108666.1 hypothetical protein [Planctomycetaceae bacterium]